MNDYGLATSPESLRLERLLPGPIERVWEYLTDSDKRALWLASGPMEPRAGGALKLVFRNSALTQDDAPAPAKYAAEAGEVGFESRVLACEPPRLLAWLWGDGSEVRFDLEPQGERVRLVITHSRLAARSAMVSVATGWHTHTGLLMAHLEGRRPAGFWATFARLEPDYEARIPQR